MLERRKRQIEMHALDQQVGRDHDFLPGGRGQDGGIVADAEHAGNLGEGNVALQAADEAKLAELGKRS